MDLQSDQGANGVFLSYHALEVNLNKSVSSILLAVIIAVKVLRLS